MEVLLVLAAVLLILPVLIAAIIFILNANRKQDLRRLEEELSRVSDANARLKGEVRQLQARLEPGPEQIPAPAPPPTPKPAPIPPPPAAVFIPVPKPAPQPAAVQPRPSPPPVPPPPPRMPPEPAVAPSPPPPLLSPPAPREDLETRFGTRWLNRIGAAILVLGVALFLGYAFTELGPWGKIGLAYTVTLGLLGGLAPRAP